MFSPRIIVLPLFAMLLSGIAFAQNENGKWEGAVSLNGGTNFKIEEYNMTDPDGRKYSYYMNDINARIGYRQGKLNFSMFSSFNKSNQAKLKDAVSATATAKDTTAIIEDSHSVTERRIFKIGTGFSYDFNDRNKLKASYTFTSDENNPSRNNLTLDFMKVKLKASEEIGHNVKYSHLLQTSYTHNLANPSKTLSLDAYVQISNEQQISDWQTGNLDTVSLYWLRYRLMPERSDREFKLSALYSDPVFSNVKNLTVQLGMDVQFKMDDDENCAITKIDDVLVDSTQYREVFRYRSLAIDPKLYAKYKIGGLELSASYIPDFFTQMFSDENNREILEPLKVGHIFDAKATYKFDGYHRLGVNVSRRIKRPEYKQICWFLLPGTYYNEFLRGNPLLMPQVTNAINLDYTYTSGKFVAVLGLGANLEKSKIEQTFYKDTINGLPSRIKTWINSGTSQNPNVALTLKWNGSKFQADAKGIWNYNISTNNEGKVKRNSDWGVNANLSYYFKYDWALMTKFRYKSKIIRSYTSTTEYLGCDVRAQKKFGRFIVYAEGRDLFDKDITTETISSDNTSLRIENVRNCRRIFLIGASVTF